jgi:hypothetical protein
MQQHQNLVYSHCIPTFTDRNIPTLLLSMLTLTGGMGRSRMSFREVSNKLILGARRALVDKLRYEGVGKPLGLGTTIVRHYAALTLFGTRLTALH